MGGFLTPGLGSLAGGLAGGLGGFFGAGSSASAASRAQDKANDFAFMTLRHGPRLAVNGLKEAGLNPMLAAGLGGGSFNNLSMMGSGATGAGQNKVSSAISSAKDVSLLKSAVDNLNADTTKKQNDGFLSRVQATQAGAQADYYHTQNMLLGYSMNAAKNASDAAASPMGKVLPYAVMLGQGAGAISSAKDAAFGLPKGKFSGSTSSDVTTSKGSSALPQWDGPNR